MVSRPYAKDKVKVNAYAGMLFEDDDKKTKQAGRRKSAALLASRLLMAGLCTLNQVDP
jgi:hypothetical protein